MNEVVTDAIVYLDGKNGGFHSWMAIEEANRIMNNGGLQEAGCAVLRETDDRPIPQTLKDGQVEITDIHIKLEPNVFFYLN